LWFDRVQYRTMRISTLATFSVQGGNHHLNLFDTLTSGEGENASPHAIVMRRSAICRTRANASAGAYALLDTGGINVITVSSALLQSSPLLRGARSDSKFGDYSLRMSHRQKKRQYQKAGHKVFHNQILRKHHFFCIFFLLGAQGCPQQELWRTPEKRRGSPRCTCSTQYSTP
jgi:hypothetical protein